MPTFIPTTRPIQIEVGLHRRLKQAAANTESTMLALTHAAIESYLDKLELGLAKELADQAQELQAEYLAAKEQQRAAHKKLFKKEPTGEQMMRWKMGSRFAAAEDAELERLVTSEGEPTKQ